MSTCDVNDRRSIESSAVVTSQCDRARASTTLDNSLFRDNSRQEKIVRSIDFEDRRVIDNEFPVFAIGRRVKP